MSERSQQHLCRTHGKKEGSIIVKNDNSVIIAEPANAFGVAVATLMVDSTYESRELVWNVISKLGMPILKDVQSSVRIMRSENKSESEIAANPALRSSNRTKQNAANFTTHTQALIDQLVLDNVMDTATATASVKVLTDTLTAVCSTWQDAGNKPSENKKETNSLFANLL